MYFWSFLRCWPNYIHFRYSNYFKSRSPNVYSVYIRAYTVYIKPVCLRILEILIKNCANKQASDLVSPFVGETTVCFGLHYQSATEYVTAENDSIFYLPLHKQCPLETESVSNCLALQMFLNFLGEIRWKEQLHFGFGWSKNTESCSVRYKCLSQAQMFCLWSGEYQLIRGEEAERWKTSRIAESG